jgi:hypothetical protein
MSPLSISGHRGALAGLALWQPEVEGLSGRIPRSANLQKSPLPEVPCAILAHGVLLALWDLKPFGIWFAFGFAFKALILLTDLATAKRMPSAK